MDRYGARGELLAAQTQSVLGPCLVDSGTDTAVVYNGDGTQTVYRKGMKAETRRTPTWDDPVLQLTRAAWLENIRDKHSAGSYGYSPKRFAEDVEHLRNGCYGELTDGDEAWIEWARNNVTLLDPYTEKPIGTYKEAI
jgi:hypothetical protein